MRQPWLLSMLKMKWIGNLLFIYVLNSQYSKVYLVFIMNRAFLVYLLSSCLFSVAKRNEEDRYDMVQLRNPNNSQLEPQAIHQAVEVTASGHYTYTIMYCTYSYSQSV